MSSPMMGGWETLRALRKEGDLAGHQVARGTARRIMAFARPYRRDISVFLVTVVFDAVIGVATPVLAGDVVNRITRGGPDAASGIVRIALFIAGLAIADSFLSLAQRWYSARIGEGIILSLRTRVYDHVQRMPLQFFTRTQTGALVSRLNNDVGGAQRAFTSTLSGVVSNVIQLVLTAAVMFTISWQVTVLSLLLLPLFVLPARRVGRRLADLTRESYKLDATMNATMTERFGVAGALLVKLFGQPDNESARFAERAGRVRDIGVQTAMYSRVFFVSMLLVASLAQALTYGVGGCARRSRRDRRGHRGHARAAPHPALRPAHLAVQRAGRRDERARLVRARLRSARPQAGHRRAARRGHRPGRHGPGRVPRRAVPLPERGGSLARLARGRGHAGPHGHRRGAARRLLHRRAGTDGRARRAVRRRQVDHRDARRRASTTSPTARCSSATSTSATRR